MMKHLAVLITGCLLLLVAVLFGTDPNHVFSFVLILPFILLFALLTLICSVLFHRRGFSGLRSLRMGGFLAGLPVILLIFQSIGQLTVRDVATILALFVISYFYITRANAKAE